METTNITKALFLYSDTFGLISIADIYTRILVFLYFCSYLCISSSISICLYTNDYVFYSETLIFASALEYLSALSTLY
jgi:hypothetical protein